MVSEPLFSMYRADESEAAAEPLESVPQDVSRKQNTRKNTSTRFIDANYTASHLLKADSVSTIFSPKQAGTLYPFFDKIIP